VLLSLDISKANGPDDISNRLLKTTAKVISQPLTEIFNASLEQSYFPLILKDGIVVRNLLNLSAFKSLQPSLRRVWIIWQVLVPKFRSKYISF
jgi:hypothetical protein